MPKRCTATTSKSQPCQAWAVADTDPPRCAAHGGASAPPGAPAGNQNARTHGAYSRPDIEPKSIDDLILIGSRATDRVEQYIEERLFEMKPDEFLALSNLLGQLLSRVGRLLRIRQQLIGNSLDGLGEEVAAALKITSKKLGAFILGEIGADE